ncbi:hypothetical protein NMY22_g6533 [Coprinellus aureogranulatus]|nr:hypothetical protein NMY22_g6533 [Coprinellus aureogranulatus]
MESKSPFSDLLNTNYSATPGQVEEIEKWIGRYQGVEVHDRRQTHVDLIKKHRDLTSPTRRLPADILVAIFSLLAVHGKDTTSPDPAVIASHVCKGWRDIALATPLLWTRIFIVLPMYPIPFSTDDHTQMPYKRLSKPDQEAHNIRLSQYKRAIAAICAKFTTFIARSAECPLEISLTAHDIVCPHEVLEEICEDIFNPTLVIDPIIRVLTSSASNLWKSFTLTLGLHSMASMLPVFMRFPVGFSEIPPHAQIPSIELDLMWHGEGDNRRMIWEQTVTGGKVDLRRASPTSLTLRMEFADMARIETRWEALTSMTLVFRNSSFHHSFAPVTTPPIRLEKLRYMALGGSAPPIEFANALVLPALSELSVMCVSSQTEDESKSALVVWAKRYGQQLTHVSLNCTLLTTTALSCVLKHLPNVNSLELRQVKIALDEIAVAAGVEINQPKLDISLLEQLTPKGGESSSGVEEGCASPKLERLVGCSEKR